MGISSKVSETIRENNTSLLDAMRETYNFDGVLDAEEREMLDVISQKGGEKYNAVDKIQQRITEIMQMTGEP
jgi:hypothetical protein